LSSERQIRPQNIVLRVNVPRGGSISGEGNSDFLFCDGAHPPRLADGPAVGDAACSAIRRKTSSSTPAACEHCHHPSPFPADDPGTTPEIRMRIASLPARMGVRVRRR
jgi:hypothetical protein